MMVKETSFTRVKAVSLVSPDVYSKHKVSGFQSTKKTQRSCSCDENLKNKHFSAMQIKLLTLLTEGHLFQPPSGSENVSKMY